MHFTTKVQNVCSTKVDFDLVDGKVYNVVFTGGCNGNLKAIGKLVEGMEKDRLVSILKGNTCGPSSTSCADQLAQAVEKAVEA
ncbi:MAG: TIGR03905 family TSCPD domain-containing protein [Clostridia bacterium]|jgi:uncharacterized protein (TIGR03905 family)|nr:TIGR03905 family TSCPD domain-containing protein [Clostridia bacterium]